MERPLKISAWRDYDFCPLGSVEFLLQGEGQLSTGAWAAARYAFSSSDFPSAEFERSFRITPVQLFLDNWLNRLEQASVTRSRLAGILVRIMIDEKIHFGHTQALFEDVAKCILALGYRGPTSQRGIQFASSLRLRSIEKTLGRKTEHQLQRGSHVSRLRDLQSKHCDNVRDFVQNAFDEYGKYADRTIFDVPDYAESIKEYGKVLLQRRELAEFYKKTEEIVETSPFALLEYQLLVLISVRLDLNKKRTRLISLMEKVKVAEAELVFVMNLLGQLSERVTFQNDLPQLPVFGDFCDILHQILDLTQVICRRNSSATANDEQDTQTTKWMELTDRTLATIRTTKHFLSDLLTSIRNREDSELPLGISPEAMRLSGMMKRDTLRRTLAEHGIVKSMSLIIDVRWYYLRLATGWWEDICLDTNLMDDTRCYLVSGSAIIVDYTRCARQLRRITDAFSDFWDSVREDPCSLPCEFFYRLEHCRRDFPYVDSFLKGVEDISERPYIRPYRSRFEQIRKLNDVVFVWPRRYRRTGVLLPSKNILVAKENNDIVRIDLITGSELENWGYRARVMCMGVSADESTVVSGSYHGIVLIWQNSVLKPDKIQVSSQAVCEIALSPGCKSFAVVLSDGTLHFWSLTERKEIFSIGGGPKKIECISFSANGEHILSGCADMTLSTWCSTSGKLVSSRKLGGGHRISHVTCFAADECLSGQANGTVCLWRWDCGVSELICELTSRCSTGVASIHTSKVSTHHNVLVCFMDGSTRIWAIEESKPKLVWVDLGEVIPAINRLGLDTKVQEALQRRRSSTAAPQDRTYGQACTTAEPRSRCLTDIVDFLYSMSILESGSDLENGWLPLSVLSRLWGLSYHDTLSFCRNMNHAGIFQCALNRLKRNLSRHPSFSKQIAGTFEEALSLSEGYSDVLLFRSSRAFAVSPKMNNFTNFHENLLNSCIPPTIEGGFNLRPWWNMELNNCDYLRRHLVKHLLGAELFNELFALLLDWKWLLFRREIGGIVQLYWDFATACQLMEDRFGDSIGHVAKRRKHESNISNLVPQTVEDWKGFLTIFGAIVMAWPRILDSPEVLRFELFLRLLPYKEKFAMVRYILEHIEESQDGPWLRPLRGLKLPAAGIDPIIEMSRMSENSQLNLLNEPHFISFRNSLMEATSSLDSAENSPSIHKAQSERQEKLQLYTETPHQLAAMPRHCVQGHKAVLAIAGNKAGTLIISCSADATLQVWDAVTMHPIGEPLRGHKSPVTHAHVTPNDRYIFSKSTDDEIRIWDFSDVSPVGRPVNQDFVLRIAESDSVDHIWKRLAKRGSLLLPEGNVSTSHSVISRGQGDDHLLRSSIHFERNSFIFNGDYPTVLGTIPDMTSPTAWHCTRDNTLVVGTTSGDLHWFKVEVPYGVKETEGQEESDEDASIESTQDSAAFDEASTKLFPGEPGVTMAQGRIAVDGNKCKLLVDGKWVVAGKLPFFLNSEEWYFDERNNVLIAIPNSTGELLVYSVVD